MRVLSRLTPKFTGKTAVAKRRRVFPVQRLDSGDTRYWADEKNERLLLAVGTAFKTATAVPRIVLSSMV